MFLGEQVMVMSAKSGAGSRYHPIDSAARPGLEIPRDDGFVKLAAQAARPAREDP